MGVYKRGKVWWYKFVWSGVTIRESSKVSNKRNAEQIEAAHKTSLAKGEVGIREKVDVPTLAEFAPRFTQAIETICADKPRTVSFYRDKLKCLVASNVLSGRKLDEIDEAVIETYKQQRTHAKSKAGKPLAVATVNRELATLRRMLRLAQEWKVINRVPRLRLLRGEHCREFVLSYKIEAAYLAALPAPFDTVALVLLDTGLRVSEVLSLEWGDVRMDPAPGASYGYLTVRAGKSKNSKARNVPLTARVAKALKESATTRAGYVFQREGGKPLCQTWLNEQHRGARDALKMSKEFVPHSLRHTFGTRLGESGGDVFTIMKLMGHSSVTVSQRYVHPSPESVERAFARLEAQNSLELDGVGTKMGTAENGEVAFIQ